MSGIAGIYYLNGRPVDDEQVSRMVHRMEHRGPDEQRVWTDGAVGLGHCMLHTTPESLHETLPHTNAESGCTITADARIDNRDELFSALRIRPATDEVIPDSTLILRAYEKWGEGCVDHLLGDFVFAIWDGREDKLFCARDHFGVRPFYYYHKPGELFAFGSEIKALLTLEEVPRHLNEVRIADYITVMHGDKEITEYSDVLRLPPATRMSISKYRLKKSQYWELSPLKPIDLDSNEAYAARFYALLQEAVVCRMRSVQPVATELSGGLDSSFVTCLARNQALQNGQGSIRSISAYFSKTPPSDERSYIKEIADLKGVESYYIDADQNGPLSVLDEVTCFIDEAAFLGGGHNITWIVYKQAAETDSCVILSGFDGDTTVDHGLSYLRHLARNGKWERFGIEASQLVARYSNVPTTQPFLERLSSPWAVINSFARDELKHLLQAGKLVSFVSAITAINKYLDVSLPSLLRNLIGATLNDVKRKVATSNSPNSGKPPFLDEQFVQRIQYRQRQEEYDHSVSRDSIRSEQANLLSSGVFAISLELLDHYAAAHSLEVRHPYMDKRLIEFALRLPQEQSLSEGWTRVVMRRAMEDVVPERIRYRLTKANLQHYFARQMVEEEHDLLSDLTMNLGLLEPFVHQARVRELLSSVSRLTGQGTWRLQHIANLSYWFNQKYARWGEQYHLKEQFTSYN